MEDSSHGVAVGRAAVEGCGEPSSVGGGAVPIRVLFLVDE